ncbi:TIM barrel protein [Streptomyces sp. NA04227]|uniref:sugar phosphate isomerase/epimerase family protein n=1 Tax=Streptomyces sp. NA04227 TaxID=2742136 RepID=UPI00159166EE|nr:sugar phosphate isomerase/epimerase family protein [Streptomyces sp. NA04227]QKW08808.1 TIM barrel protein [Streptomyces sp. NA04227]
MSGPRYAFSTLGLPGRPLDEVLALATAHGYAGVELRAHPEEPVHPGLDSAQRASAARQFAAAGIAVSAVAGYAQVAEPGPDEPVLDDIRTLAGLAHDLGAGFVRVFPGGGDAPREEADAVAARRLAAAAVFTEPLGVRVLMETHDSHRRAADVARVLDAAGPGTAGPLWDVMHTWLGGETPTESLKAFGNVPDYVQVKDIASAEDTTPLPLGAGVLPLAECLSVLGGPDYEGWLCWEYEKRWYEKAAPLGPLLGAGRAHLAGLVEQAGEGAAKRR